jgi:hypothetical protein
MERSNSLLAGTCIAISALAIAMFPGKSEARPNCPTCLAGYEACLASGASDCDTRYAACLRWCPYPAKTDAASSTVAKGLIRGEPQPIALEKSEPNSTPITLTRVANVDG